MGWTAVVGTSHGCSDTHGLGRGGKRVRVDKYYTVNGEVGGPMTQVLLLPADSLAALPVGDAVRVLVCWYCVTLVLLGRLIPNHIVACGHVCVNFSTPTAVWVARWHVMLGIVRCRDTRSCFFLCNVRVWGARVVCYGERGE